MKRTIVVLWLMLPFYQVGIAQVTSSCVVPPLLKMEYKRDVAQLASYRLYQLQSPDTDLVQIPPAYTDSIFEGLAAIFNATSIPERDSVFNLYCVHNLNPFAGYGGYSGFIVKVDTNYAWTQAWQNLNTLTGDPLMDTILTKYHLSISNFYNWTIGNYAELSVDSSWNIYALIDSIDLVPGVVMTELNSWLGVAGKITYDLIGNSKYYNFYFEYQDCFDGCDAYRNWKFKVNSDCSVEYLGVEDWCYWDQLGTPGLCPLPVPINCNTFTPIEEIDEKDGNFVIFPNPSNGIFQIGFVGMEINENPTLTIFNLLGELVYSTEINSNLMQIDLGAISKGVYLVRLNDGQTILTNKIVIH
ncbi:MAG: T9SS type A sorting domain-containing protein [Bacteroidetes bacterium]|nr:T9SS type A sorting domain-containing protein [Bacteroidota bacterium]